MDHAGEVDLSELDPNVSRRNPRGVEERGRAPDKLLHGTLQEFHPGHDHLWTTSAWVLRCREEEADLHQDGCHRVAQLVRSDRDELIARPHRLAQLFNQTILVHLAAPAILAITDIVHATSSMSSGVGGKYEAVQRRRAFRLEDLFQDLTLSSSTLAMEGTLGL
jgi:hypothetical protein